MATKLTGSNCPAAGQQDAPAVRSGAEWFDTNGNVIQVHPCCYARLLHFNIQHPVWGCACIIRQIVQVEALTDTLTAHVIVEPLLKNGLRASGTVPHVTSLLHCCQGEPGLHCILLLQRSCKCNAAAAGPLLLIHLFCAVCQVQSLSTSVQLLCCC